jgi:hypothetical protein
MVKYQQLWLHISLLDYTIFIFCPTTITPKPQTYYAMEADASFHSITRVAPVDGLAVRITAGLLQDASSWG